MPQHPIFLKDYQPSAFKIQQLQLTFELHAEKTRVTSVMIVERQSIAAPDLCLQGEQLILLSIRLNGETPQYRKEEGSLRLFNVPDVFSLEIITELYPQQNTALTGLYLSNHIFCTQCEAEYFRKITYFLDRPDVLTLFSVKIIADKTQYPVLLSNGNLIQQGELENNQHFALWQDPFKKPSYLFALVAGDLAKLTDCFVTRSGRRVQLAIYAEKPWSARCAFALVALKKAMRWDEVQYGREYDLDVFNIVAVHDFIFGAMENKSLNIFNAKYILADSSVATDQDYADIDTVIAHEYFHNWSGNRVTCRDWFQLSLKEGFTIFREQSYDEDQHSRVVQRIRQVQELRNAQFAEDAGPLAHPVRPDSYWTIDNFYTATVYNKGGELIRMLKTLLGPEVYRCATDEYFEKFDGQAVTTDDFLEVMQRVSGQDLTSFRYWYTQAGTLRVQATGHYDPVKKIFVLTLEQTLPTLPDGHPQLPMMIPLKIALLSTVSPTQHGPEETLILREQRQIFAFSHPDGQVIPSLNRHFSAPMILEYPYTVSERLFLFQHDNDGFNRWEAGQQLMTDWIVNGVSPEEMASLHAVVATILRAPVQDYALVTAWLTVPSEKSLQQYVTPIDVHAIAAARSALLLSLAQTHEAAWCQHYHTLVSSIPSAYTPENRAQRGFKALCLEMLVRLEKPAYMQLAYQQCLNAPNMTDSMAALNILAHTDTLERVQAFALFEDRWQHEPLVMNKWLLAQAQSRLPSTLRNVQRLLQQPFFNINNPNTVYALLGGFCGQNITQFHAPDGVGYEFCADRVLQLDKLNPMVAARILEPLLAWERFVSPQNDLMRNALTRIMRSALLSNNVQELISKALHIEVNHV